jgi:NAD(P)-dependent dehydrogenase (short-subunit alcohol dehydrogenase family)
VSLSSAVAVRTGAPGTWVHFAATKAAIETLSRGLARELAAEGIRVNVVRPGMILTETRLTQSAEYRARLLAQVPMARLGEPGEVAAAVLWLLSPAASYVTGAELEVSGGL